MPRKLLHARRATLLGAVLGLTLLTGGAADAATRSLAPLREHRGVLTFRLKGIKPAEIRAAHLRVGAHRYRVRLRRVRAGARRGRLHLRMSPAARRRYKSAGRKKVRLVLTLPDRPTPTRPEPGSPVGGGPGQAPAASSPPALGAPLSFPIRAAFYYPWFPETWTVGGSYTHFHPSLGYYRSDDPSVQQAHIRALDYAGVHAAISEWSPPPHYRDDRLKALLAQTVAMQAPLRWAIYYALEGSSDPAPSTIAAALAYVRDQLAANPAYLRVGDRFVVFVWSSGPTDQSCSLADRWKAANQQIGNAAYVVLKVFSGYRNCAAQPDSWHQYGPAVAASAVPGHSYSISPGFWKADERTPRLARDLGRFRQSIDAMVASQAPWQLVTTFNEWGEGTAVESAAEWASGSGHGAYLDALNAALRRRG